MKTKYTLFRRGAVYYSQDSATGKQTKLAGSGVIWILRLGKATWKFLI